MTPPFTLFSVSHFAAVVTTIAVMVLAIQVLHRHAPRLHEERFNHRLAILILFVTVAWEFSDMMREDYSLATDLPFHLCDVTPFLLAAYLWKPRRQLFDVLYYWILAGAPLALIIPDLQVGYPSGRFIGFFITHSFPLFGMLYLVLIRDIKPSPKSYITAFFALNLYALVIAAPMNLLVGGNYVYLCRVPEVDFGPISLLPPWPWYIILLELFALVLLRALYQPYHLRAIKEEESKLLPKNSAPHH